MMVLFLIASSPSSLASAVAASSSASLLDLSEAEIGAGTAGGSVKLRGSVPIVNPGTQASPRNQDSSGRNTASVGTAANDQDYYLTLVNGPDGLCLGWTTDPRASLTSASAGLVTSLYDVCPANPAEEAVPPGVLAQIEVLKFWQTKPVPRMELQIDPGWAITGLRAYLETGPDATTATTLDFTTPIGNARADITANYLVDWGDDTGTETYTVNGGEYPEGDISHVYKWPGDHTVTATQQWTGTWQMTSGPANGIGGQLPALPMTDTLDLYVDEVQAVIQ